MKKLSDLFHVTYGTKFDYNKMTPSDDSSGIAFVSRTSKNNGVVSMVERYNDVNPIPKGNITVTLGGTYVLSSFVQIHDFYTAQNVAVLYPKEDMCIREKIYLCACIKMNRFKYGAFGREANTTLKDIEVPDLSEIPDWVYSLELPDFESHKKPAIEMDEYIDFNSSLWKEFDITSLFKLSKGKYYPKSSYGKGNTPLISATDTNNGIADYTDLEPTYQGNCLTLGKVKMSVYYQESPFCCSHDVTVLEPMYKFNQYIGMFVKVVLQQDQYRYNYGRQIQLNVAKGIKIKLPVDANGNPDWDFMENYIKQLPYSSSI